MSDVSNSIKEPQCLEAKNKEIQRLREILFRCYIYFLQACCCTDGSMYIEANEKLKELEEFKKKEEK